ncbi:hypothetical protein HI914_06354 [Erysiphe necator]|nr:hypothetical protein HI914_06354 [Erysiphe necator]
MLSLSIFIFAFLIFNGSISALPRIDFFESNSDFVNPLSRELQSEKPRPDYLPHQRKRALSFGKSAQKAEEPLSGVKCDTRFYKQSRVDALVGKACRQDLNSKGKTRSSFSKLFRTAPKKYTGPANFFPNMKDLNMRPISQGFFSSNQLRRLRGSSRSDFMVFSGQCTPVGVVKQLGKNQMELCASFLVDGKPGKDPLSKENNSDISRVITPTRPAGATQPQNGAQPVVPTRPQGATQPQNGAQPVVPTRPEGATQPQNGAQPVVPTRPEGATQPQNGAQPVVPTRPEGAG